jgi:hypothetical protein
MMMKLDNTATPDWLRPLADALRPDCPTMRAFEQAERIVRAARERDILFSLDLQRWANA